MKQKFFGLELILYVLTIVLMVTGIVAMGMVSPILFQADQDPTFIIYTIFFLFTVASLWVISEMVMLLMEHRTVSQVLPRLGRFLALELTPTEQKSVFGNVLIGIRIAHQQNPLHEIDYRAEVGETVADIDTRHANIRFIAKVAQYLGVIGTMLGLIIALGVLYRDLSVEQQNLQQQILDAIKNSMSGMYAAYATSVAGLFLGSIVLTFGCTLLRNALDKYELRLLTICRRFIAPQLGLHLNPAEAEGKSFDVLIRSLQGVMEQFQLLHASGEAHTLAVRANNERMEQMMRQQAGLQQQLGTMLVFMERVAIFSSRVMGIPLEPPPPPPQQQRPGGQDGKGAAPPQAAEGKAPPVAPGPKPQPPGQQPPPVGGPPGAKK